MNTPDGKNYALGRGKLFFAMFAAGTLVAADGQRYFGNTPEFSTTSESEELEHFDSDNGVNIKDDSVTLSNTRSGSFTTDNISLDNVAMFYLGEKSSFAQAAQTGVTTTVTAKRGRYYQLGETEANPSGVRKLTTVAVTVNAVPLTVDIGLNLEYDMELGRVYIESDAPDIADDDVLVFTWSTAAYTQNKVISSSNEIVGAMYFECTNPKGEKYDYFWPYVKISPNGDFNLKSGDDWQSIPFNVEFLKKDGYETVYITDRAVTA